MSAPGLFCVVAGAEPVDGNDRLIADNPGVMTTRERRDITRTGDELAAIVHANRQPPAHVVLEMRRLAAVGLRDGLHVVRPAPSGLEDEAPHLPTTNLDDLRPSIGKLAHLVRALEAAMLGL